jgi:predicted dehydrogenase
MEVIVQRTNGEPYKLYKNSDYDSNNMYIEQLNKFICMVEEGRTKHKYDALSSLESLKVVEALFKSNLTGRRIDIERNEKFSF